MTLDEIIKDARSELNEPVNGGIFTDFELAALVNRGQDLIASKIIEADMNFFEQSDQTLAFTSGQEEIPLPAALWDRKITRVTRTDLTIPKQLTKIRFQDKERYHSSNVFSSGAFTDADVYYLRGNFIGLKPTPAFTYTPVNGVGNLLIHYIRMPHELHFCDIGAPTSTTGIIPVSTTGQPKMRAGRVSTTPNYYVGARIRFITPNYKSYGSEAVITAFNVNTRTITFSPAVDFSDVPCSVNYVQYVVLTPIPIEYHDILYQYVIWRGAKKKGDSGRESSAMNLWRTLMDNLIETIEPRTYDENVGVRPPVDQYLD